MNIFGIIKDFSGVEQVFLTSAVLGMFLLILQGILVLLGLQDDGDFDELSFKWLSKQALIGFFMFFGWTGLTCIRQFNLSTPLSLGLGFLAGIVSVLCAGYLVKLTRKLKSSGSIFRIEDALGKTGVVYQKISKDHTGKITLILGGISHEIEALCEGSEEIASFTPVKVIKIQGPHTVVVAQH